MNRNQFNDLVGCIGLEYTHLGPGRGIDSLCLSDGDCEYMHVFKAARVKLHDVRSLSKLVVSLCIGIAIDSGQYVVDGHCLSLDTRIWSTFKGKVRLTNTSNAHFVKNITIKHLLTQTTGYSSEKLLLTSSLRRRDMGELLDIVFNEPIVYAPGTCFRYSNASAFILSAFFQELTGETLYCFAQRALFKPLTIKSHSWRSFGKYSAGATGLALTSQGVHNLGKLLLNKGIWRERQIVSEGFVDKMTEPHVRINNDRGPQHTLLPTGYGFFIWINRGGYYVSGANGQYIIIRPNKQRVISVLANEQDSFPLLKCIKDVL